MTKEPLHPIDPSVAVLGEPGGNTRPRYASVAGSEHSTYVRDVIRPTFAAGTKFVGVADEARATGNLMASERGQRIEEAAQPFVKALAAAATAFLKQAEVTTKAWNTATVVEPFSDTAGAPLHRVLAAHELATRFHNMEPAQRAATLGRAIADPKANMSWVEALLRSDDTLSGLTAQERDKLRLAALEAHAPARLAVLRVEVAQRDNARKALADALHVLREQSVGAAREAAIAHPEINEAIRWGEAR